MGITAARFQFRDIEILMLYAHYHLYQEGWIDQVREWGAAPKEFPYADQFEIDAAIHDLKRLGYLRPTKSKTPVITGKGICRIQAELARKESFLRQQLQDFECFAESGISWGLRLELGDRTQEFTIPLVHYGFRAIHTSHESNEGS